MRLEKDDKRLAIQCKRYSSRVTVGHIREFIGALTATRIDEGIFVALSGVTAAAQHLADDNNIAILDADDLAQLYKKAHS